MTATEIRPVEGAGEQDRPVAPMEPRQAPPKKGGFSRRLPWAFVVVALAVGYGIGNNGGGGGTKVATGPTPAVTPQQINEALSGNGLGITAVNDRGFGKLENGFQHKHTFPLPLSPAQQALLSHQMDLTRRVALRFPTYQSAINAGMFRAGPFSPGLGTHLIMTGNYGYGAGKGVMTDAQIEHPLAWIYDGTHPDSKVAGLFYMAQYGVENPGGFAGPNDVWHVHKNICTVFTKDGIDVPLGADRDATKAQCDAYHGTLQQNTGKLLHVWTVPGYEDELGVFAHNSPSLTCNDGTYHEIDITHIPLGTMSTCLDHSE